MLGKRKALVLGGSGFVGSHVADALQEAGYEVTIFDHVASPHLRAGQKMSVGNVLDEKAVRAACRGVRVVYHFAGIADIERANAEPLEAVRQNILSTAVALDAARRANVKRFVYASSVYVSSASGGTYRVTKLASEQLIEEYGTRGLSWTVLRFGSLYGPRARAGNAVYDHLREVFRTGKITREGDGTEIREYLHVADAARGAVEILKSEYANRSIVISGRSPMKVRDFLRLISEILGGKVRVKYVKPSKLHYGIAPYAFRPSLATRLLLPNQIDLGEGILHYLHEVHQELGEPPLPWRRKDPCASW